MSRNLIVDAHHHFWGAPTQAEYPWMTDELAAIRRPFGPDDLRPNLRQHNIDRTVLVQTRSSVEETREFLAIAAATDFVAGVVGWVDLTDPGVGATLRQLKGAPGGQKLVGIRHQVHDEPDPRWLLRDDVRRGLRAVGEAGLAYDLLLKPRELPAALQVAREFRDLRLVVDHIAKPPIATGDKAAWESGMAQFSALSHVHCKLSGMVTEADWAHWRPEHLRPYIQAVAGWFGEDRLLFGSDWPVCLLAASYTQVFDALLLGIEGVSEAARAKILGANAVRFYGLDGGGQ